MRVRIILGVFLSLLFAAGMGVAQINWERSPNNSVLVAGSEENWDEAGVAHPSVLFDGDRYHLWYAGENGSLRSIGYARSDDGVVWEEYPANPVLEDGAGPAWDGKMVSQPAVIFADGIYHLWYAGSDGGEMRIGYATSGDGAGWGRIFRDPVLEVGVAGGWDSKGVSSPSVVSGEGVLRIWYTGSDGQRPGIGYASSYAGGSSMVRSPIGMDFDPREGDQGKTTAGGAVPGKSYSLEMHIANAPEISGWRAVIEYDPDRLLYQGGSFEAGDFIPELLTLEDVGERSVEVGGAVLELAFQNSGDGFLGGLSFQVRDGFIGSTELVITRVGLLRADGTEENLSVRESVIITPEPDSRLVGDFDGSGAVDFSDFFLFVEAFGGEDPAFDLDASGAVDFEDFFLFAESFNRDTRGKLIALAGARLGLPSVARLEPNYPNPFNGETVIAFELPTAADVDLVVFDLAGQEVAKLADGFRSAGRHVVCWNDRDGIGRELASGVYLYVLRVGERQEERRKMVLVR